MLFLTLYKLCVVRIRHTISISEDVQYKQVNHQVLAERCIIQKYFPVDESLLLLIYQVKMSSSLCIMVPVLKKFPPYFSLFVKKFCFSLVFCENFRLQTQVNLANLKIKNSVVIIFDSNSSNFWRMIFQNPKNLNHLSFKRIFTDFRPFTDKMYGKSTYRICSRNVWKIWTDSPCLVVDIMDSWKFNLQCPC